MIIKAIKYGTKSCIPCRITEANLKAAGLEVESIDLEEHEEIAEQKGIRSVPYVEFFDENNTLVKKQTGLLSLEKIQEILG